MDDWWNLYSRLAGWHLELDSRKELGLNETLDDQLRSANRGFVKYVTDNYRNWVHSERDNRPLLSVDVVPDKIISLLNKNEKILFVVVDCFRFDQALGILPMIQKLFKAEIGYHVSLLPSATPFARNGIFSGRFLSEIQNQEPELWQMIANSESSMNWAKKSPSIVCRPIRQGLCRMIFTRWVQ